MAKRRWTVVFVPHGAEPSRIVELSASIFKIVGGAMLVLVLSSLLVGYAIAGRAGLPGLNKTKQDQAVLNDEISSLHSRLSLLSDTLNQIARRDARIRLLANLEPIDPQVQAVGIGGPVGTSVERKSLASAGVLGRRTDDLRVDLNTLIRRANLLASSFSTVADSLASHTERLAATPSIMPTQGWVSSAFQSMRSHPILHIARPHEGVDVSASMGSPIEAPAAGTVVSAGWETGYGNTVVIDHGYGVETKFAHASKLMVRPGQRVQRGQRIALVGNTGLATGPHLHYEVHVNGKPVDPLKYVLPETIAD